MKRQPLEVIDSWIITGQGIIVEIKYDGMGLVKGTQLISRNTKQQWTVSSRLLFNHVADMQKRFPNEAETFMHLAFNTVAEKEKSKEHIMRREEQEIYQYLLSPIGHNEKPIAGDLIDIHGNL